jgi:predicted Zn-dependent protease
MGLVQMLYAQSYTREASHMLDLLANEAAQRGDVETEARARADALWLKAGDGRRPQAREDATRLRTLIKQGVLSADTQRYVASRFR